MDQQELPEGWQLKPLRELIEIKYGDALRANERIGGHVKVFGSNGEIGRHNTAITRAETIIIGRKGSVGEVHYSESPCWPIDTTFFVDHFPPTSYPKYLFYFLKSSDLANLDRSTAVPGINRNDLYNIQLPLPPLHEQQRIVAKIESLFAESRTARQALDRAEPLLNKFRQAVLSTAFRGELTERDPNDEPASVLVDRIRAERRRRWEEGLRAKGKDPAYSKYMEPELPDARELGELPEGWTWSSLGELFEVNLGGTPSRKQSAYWNGDIPWASSGEVSFSRIKETRERITEAGLKNSNARLNPAGTVLLAMIGEGKTRGQSAILDVAACNNQNVAAILCPQTPIPSEYVFYWLVSRYVETREGSSGGAQPALNRARVKQIPLPVAPLSEQHRIIERVRSLLGHEDEIRRAIELAVRRADKVNQAILARAFRGEL